MLVDKTKCIIPNIDVYLVRFIILTSRTNLCCAENAKDPITTSVMLLRATTATKLFPNLHNCRHPFCFNVKFVSQQTSREIPAWSGSSQEVFYSPISNTHQVLAYVGAATQLIFWGNLAQWAGTAYALKDK